MNEASLDHPRGDLPEAMDGQLACRLCLARGMLSQVRKAIAVQLMEN